MKIKKNIAVNENGFLFNPATGDSFSANPIGSEIIRLIKDGKSDDEIRCIIIKNYDVVSEVFEKDFYDFVSQLRDFKLLEEE